jgi:DNA-binding NtrC family response regulator
MPKEPLPGVIIADDNPDILAFMSQAIQARGYRPIPAQSKSELLALLYREKPALVFLDLRFGEVDGIALLKQLVKNHPDLTVAMLTGHATIDTAVRAIRHGAYDYITKPPDMNRIDVVLGQAFQKFQLQHKIQKLESLVGSTQSRSHLLGDSLAIQKVNQTILSVAPTDATVLILGESGTGKELAARTLHESSRRASGPFVPLNMAALPRELAESLLFGHEKGAFTGADRAQAGACELAHEGTLFLDEIGEMELALQAKLLRFLQERTVQRVGQPRGIPVDVRIVAATNRDLADQVRAGHFREDLFYRLHVVPVTIPPLRDRREDIPQLALRFLTGAAIKYRKKDLTFSPEALQAMMAYEWPGNVRQLENLIERLAILCPGPIIQPVDFAQDLHTSLVRPRPDAPPTTPPTALPGLTPFPSVASVPKDLSGNDSELRGVDLVEKQMIRDALIRHRGSVRDVSQELGLSQATIYRKLKRYQLNLDQFTG